MAELRFALLGPVRAWRGGEELPLGSPRQRVALVRLLLGEGRAVSVEEVIDAVWGDEPPRGARGAVRTYVHRLRRTLGDGDDEVIASAGGGYAMAVETGAVDWGRFRMRVEAAAKARERGAMGAAADLLRSAEGLWRGEALEGLEGAFAEGVRGRLGRAREEALGIGVGASTAVVGFAELGTGYRYSGLRVRSA
ncbi:AfsR/SARP family transcriptional regulator [Umezawaea tangerina]|uniref:Transcriptional activator n=1 Tax=Umezawaea tangerina TaxID=84725 RepID=A0A2T0SE24_9PSEU|nr:winged helix-turn-helix domain-containing protein [Umezawaea tangerina]PRY31641.1 transcriptional activator [Umezawaea tangerina]